MDINTFPFEQYGPGLSTPWYPPLQNSNAQPLDNQDPSLWTTTSTEAMGTNDPYHPSTWVGELDCPQPCMLGTIPSMKNGCSDLTTSSSASSSLCPSLFTQGLSTAQCAGATRTATTATTTMTTSTTCEEEEEAQQNSFKRLFRSSAGADEEEERDDKDRDVHCRQTFSEGSVHEDTSSFLPAHSTVSAVALCKEIAAYLQHHPQHRWEDDPTTAALLRHAMSQLPKGFSQQFLSQLLPQHHLTPPPAPPLALTWHGTGSESFTASGKRQREENPNTLGSSTSSTGLNNNNNKSNGKDHNRWMPECAGGYFACVERGCRGGAAWSGAGFDPEGEGAEAFWKRLRVEAAQNSSAVLRQTAAAAVPSCREPNRAASSVVEVAEEEEVGNGEEAGAGTPALRSSLQKSAQDGTEMVDRDNDMEDAFLTGRKRVRAQPVVEFVSLGRRLE